MRKRETLEVLRDEIVIPEIVQERAAQAFARIRAEAAKGGAPEYEPERGAVRIEILKNSGADCEPERGNGMERGAVRTEIRKNSGADCEWERGEGMEFGERRAERRIRGMRRRRMWPMAAAAVLSVGILGAGAAAAYMQWSKGLEEGLRTTVEQREALEESSMAAFVGQSVTQNGVTVTAQQSVVDQHFAYLSFKVEGYTVEDGVQPDFSVIDISMEDEAGYTGGICSSFYDGLVMGEDGRAVHADGTPLSEGEPVSYMLEDGTMEYQITMYCGKAGYFIGQPIKVALKDLGTYTGKAEDVVVDVEGDWTFEWTMEGSDDVRNLELNAALGESGATAVKAELSPISIVITYDFPRQEETELAVDADGNEYNRTTYANPPYFTGVRLKDGTMYTRLSGMGSAGYNEDGSDTYTYTTALGRVIDAEQVESLLFIKSHPGGESPLTEENLYIVPVK